MNREEYLNVMFNLNQAVLADSTALLALTVAWLDPLMILEESGELEETDLTEFYESGDEMGAALRVARDCFPGIYAKAISQVRDGMELNLVSDLISAEITEQTGIPIDDYDDPVAFAYGIPMPFYGVDWDDDDFIEDHPELTDLALLLGATREQSYGREEINFSKRSYQVSQIIRSSLEEHDKDAVLRSLMVAIAHITGSSGNSSVLCGIETEMSRHQSFITEDGDQLEKVYTIGRIIAESLEQQEAEQYQQLSWTIKWMFSCSNNSCVDWDEETMYSVEPLAWIPEDVAFAIEIIAEAQIIMADAEVGLTWVKGEVGVLLALWYNARQIDQMLANKGESPVEVCLTWPDLSQDPLQQVKTLLNEWGCPVVQSD